MSTDEQILEEFTSKEYEHGWSVDFEADEAPLGINEDIIRFISAKKEEPEWLLEWRLKAFRQWQKMTEPNWANVNYPKVDYQSIRYYSAPKQEKKPKSLPATVVPMTWIYSVYQLLFLATFSISYKLLCVAAISSIVHQSIDTFSRCNQHSWNLKED